MRINRSERSLGAERLLRRVPVCEVVRQAVPKVVKRCRSVGEEVSADPAVYRSVPGGCFCDHPVKSALRKDDMRGAYSIYDKHFEPDRLTVHW